MELNDIFFLFKITKPFQIMIIFMAAHAASSLL